MRDMLGVPGPTVLGPRSGGSKAVKLLQKNNHLEERRPSRPVFYKDFFKVKGLTPWKQLFPLMSTLDTAGNNDFVVAFTLAVMGVPEFHYSRAPAQGCHALAATPSPNTAPLPSVGCSDQEPSLTDSSGPYCRDLACRRLPWGTCFPIQSPSSQRCPLWQTPSVEQSRMCIFAVGMRPTPTRPPHPRVATC